MTRLWHDPVWSKVIAAVIIALGSALYAWVGTHWLPEIVNFNWWFFGIALLGVLGGLVGGYLISRQLDQSKPNITTTSCRISPSPSPDTELKFPLKCYITLRNTSTKSADVQLSDYKSTAVTIDEFPFNVLQVQLGGHWFPNPNGASRIAVLPDQTFRAWVGLDHRNYSREFARELLIKGRIGTLVFLVDGKKFNINLKSA